MRVLRAGGGRGGGVDIIVEGGLRLADCVHQGGDAALVLQPVEGRAEDLVRVGEGVGVRVWVRVRVRVRGAPLAWAFRCQRSFSLSFGKQTSIQMR